MKQRKPKNAQNSTNNKFSATAELKAGEKSLTNYNRHLIKKLTKLNKSSTNVLEFGAGLGTLAALWELETGIQPHCLEIDPNLQSIIERRGFHCYESLDSVKKKFDLIYSSNVLEHIEDDQLALKQINSKLNEDGALIIYVPAFQILYSDLDENSGHYRRYTKHDLINKLESAGFDIHGVSYMDCIGFFAWLYIKLKRYVPNKSAESSMKAYDRFIFPLSGFLDELGFKYIFGKNLLVYARKSKSDRDF